MATLHRPNPEDRINPNTGKLCLKVQKIANLFFCMINVEKADFEQHLECAAPKYWSKYTTDGRIIKQ